MAESKRIFNQAKIDRDLDARMLPPGVYRDGLNINVGESESGDVGAVENLKGNEEITGQTGIEGTTIGSVRDPNNNRLYWFNKGTTHDAIYEYDESTGNINTILKDKVGRDKIKPKCAPEFRAFLTPLTSDDNDRPPNPIVFTTPVGGCTTPGQFNYDPNAEYDDGSCVPIINGCTNPNASNYNPNANTDDGSCITTNLSLSLSGASSATNGSNVNVTSNVSGALGSISYAWSDGTTASNNTYTGSNTTITKTLTVTDAGRTAPNNTAQASKSVQFYSSGPSSYTLTGSTVDSTGSNISASGSTSITASPGVQTSVSFVSTAALTNGYEWVTAPTATVTGLPSGVTSSSVSGGGSGTTGNASVTISGTWTPSSSPNVVVTWSGGTSQIIPSPLSVSLTGGGTTGNTANSTVSIGSSVSGGTSPYTYAWNDGSTGTSTTVTGDGVTINTSLTVTDSASPNNTASAQTTTGFDSSTPTCNNYQITYNGNNLQLNYTNCTTGNAAIYNLSNTNGATSVITMQSRTTPTQASGGSGSIYNIQQV